MKDGIVRQVTNVTEMTARAIATVSIWLGVTIILTFGLFKVYYGTDTLTFIAHVFLVITICSAAAFATVKIWDYERPNRPRN